MPVQLQLWTPPPQSDWRPPAELPDLSQETEIALDTETFDPGLIMKKGPGYYRCARTNPSTGFIAGIAVAWRNHTVYIPIRHDRKNYFDRGLVQEWLKALLAQSHTRFVFHNFAYDMGWLQAMFDVPVPVQIDDTMAMASMVDENQSSFSLDALCAWQGLPGKDERLLRQAAAYQGIAEKEVKSSIHALPAEFVGPYAGQDAGATLALASKLRPLLTAQDLNGPYDIERQLLPITLKMKQRGVRIDRARAERLEQEMLATCRAKEQELSTNLGVPVTIHEIRRNRWLKEQFDIAKLSYPMTAPTPRFPEGQASFTREFMANHPDEFPRAVYDIKKLYALADKFVKTYILGFDYRGRLHATINQFMSEFGGARSHRFSYADPPLQQMPKRDKLFASQIRGCFLPEEGEQWCSIDFRQQEYRLAVHFAEQFGAHRADEAARKYREDPNTDFHNYVALLTSLQREVAKNVNFAMIYGAGPPKVAEMSGISFIKAQEVMAQYNKELPWVKETSKHYEGNAHERGYILMIDGARNHFDRYAPSFYNYNVVSSRANPEGLDTSPCFAEEARERVKNPYHPWFNVPAFRVDCHKAFNRVIQGSGARLMKTAMVQIVKAGYSPVLQVHDELCFSVASEKDARICAEIMEHAMPQIKIPMLTDIKLGPNWGDLK